MLCNKNEIKKKQNMLTKSTPNTIGKKKKHAKQPFNQKKFQTHLLNL